MIQREPPTSKLPNEFKPFAQTTIESPYAFYRSLRTHAPVYRVPKADYYLVSRYADIKSVAMNPGRYSSNLEHSQNKGPLRADRNAT